MHVIEIRVYDKVLKKYIPFTSLPNINFKSPEYIFELFSGAYDGDGNKIFEGDILFCKNRFYRSHVKVTYDCQYAQFLFENRNVKEFLEFNDVKVIGNKLENPELLNV